MFTRQGVHLFTGEPGKIHRSCLRELKILEEHLSDDPYCVKANLVWAQKWGTNGELVRARALCDRAERELLRRRWLVVEYHHAVSIFREDLGLAQACCAHRSDRHKVPAMVLRLTETAGQGNHQQLVFGSAGRVITQGVGTDDWTEDPDFDQIAAVLGPDVTPQELRTAWRSETPGKMANRMGELLLVHLGGPSLEEFLTRRCKLIFENTAGKIYRLT